MDYLWIDHRFTISLPEGIHPFVQQVSLLRFRASGSPPGATPARKAVDDLTMCHLFNPCLKNYSSITGGELL